MVGECSDRVKSLLEGHFNLISKAVDFYNFKRCYKIRRQKYCITSCWMYDKYESDQNTYRAPKEIEMLITELNVIFAINGSLTKNKIVWIFKNIKKFNFAPINFWSTSTLYWVSCWRIISNSRLGNSSDNLETSIYIEVK